MGDCLVCGRRVVFYSRVYNKMDLLHNKKEIVMEQYIPKSALLAEIERLVNNYDKALDYEAALEDVRNFIESMQEEPKKKCMYSNDNYTNEDRQVLCDGCEELCKYNSKTVAESLGISQEEYDKIVDECIYGKEPELVDVDDLPNKEEEPVSEELEKELSAYVNSKEYTNSIGTSGLLLIARHFANWQKEKDSVVSEDLEEAANNALNNVLNAHEIVNVRSCLEMFKSGAKWKEERIMAKAINGIARPDDGEVWCDLKPFNFKDGDKVKVIVIKEE